MTKNIYYLFSSITFLQFYIPIVIESTKRGYNNIFIFNHKPSTKSYANIYSKHNYKIIKEYLNKYKITEIRSDKIKLDKLQGIVFMIDGDIYGPPRLDRVRNSLLFNLNKETLRISLTEHMNFWAVYHYFINDINYACFTNKNIIDQMKNFNNEVLVGKTIVNCSKSYENKKNIFLGNTKFENIPAKDYILKKFNLNKNNKYCLFLYPKWTFHFNETHILNIYSYLHKLGFKIIVKQRPKDKIIDKKLKGDLFVCSDIYPNESLELMKISDLCIISSSSANEETIFSEIPCIDLISDPRPWERNQYLLNEKIYVRIEMDIWKNISFDKFKNIYNSLEKKNSDFFKSLKEKFNLNITNCSERLLDFAELSLNK